MRRTTIGLILGALLFLSACGPDNVLEEGKVDNLAYHPAETSYVPGPCNGWSSRLVTSGYGQYRTTRSESYCISYSYVPHVEPEHWKVRIVGMHDGEERREWHRVPEECHDRVQVGQWVQLDGCRVVPR